MKRLSIIIMALASIVMMTSFVPSENSGKDKSLETLWKKYEAAASKDRIQDMAEILEDVKEAALAKKASWDYFKACETYVNVKARRNWKLRDSLRLQAGRELHDYGLPSLEIMFALHNGEAQDLIVRMIEENKEEMESDRSRDVYEGADIFDSRSNRKFHDLMADAIDNDYEFILWAFRQYRGYGNDWIYDRLEEYYGDEYPLAQYARYLRITNAIDSESMKSELQDMASEYAGKGVGVLAEDELLGLEFQELGDEASSEEYLNLKKRILSFEKRCSALKGDEAVIAGLCKSASAVLELMEEESSRAEVHNGEANIIFRNMDKVRLVILKEKKKVFETEVVNGVRSFYKADTVKVEIPVLDDGTYRIELYDGSHVMNSSDYEKYTVSFAGRFASDGMCVYAAGYLTGEPLKKADLLLYDSKKNKVAEVKGFEFDGFTPLPEEIYPLKDNKGYYLVCRYESDGVICQSRELFISNQSVGSVRNESRISANVMKDRGAFVPGDTVRFKAVLYEVHPDESMTVLPEGREVKVKMMDPERNVVAETLLTTNEYGSVAGCFAIEGGGRNGQYVISAYDGERVIGSTYLIVDEFVLPNYDLIFDETDALYFPGDTIRVTGKVMNFSGHGFGGLDAVATISVYDKDFKEIPVVIAGDGSFELSFAAGDKEDDFVSYSVGMRLTDRTGETLEFHHSANIGMNLSLNARLLNHDDGDFGLTYDDGYRLYGVQSVGILGEDKARIKCWIVSKENADVPIGYELKYGGEAVREGMVSSGDTLSLDMSGLAAGIYDFEMKVSVVTMTGETVSSSKGYRFLYLTDGYDVMPCAVDRMLRAGYEDGVIAMQLGSGTGPLWAVVELFGDDRMLLKREMVNLRGVAGEAGSLVTLNFPYLDEYSDNLLLKVFYFRNGKRYQHDWRFSRPEEMYAPVLEFVSFDDSTLPGQEVSVLIKTDADVELLASVFDVSSEKIARNVWNLVRRRNGGSDVYVPYSSVNGMDASDDIVVIAYGTTARAAKAGAVMESNAVMMDSAVEEEMDVEIRDDFAATLAFEPFLRPSSEGNAELKFRTSDKLSTFKVQVYAHDKNMNNSLIDKEMIVTLPVKVSVVAPQYLYAGDRYVLNASVSSTYPSDLKGMVYLEVYDGEEYMDVEPVRVDSLAVSVPAGSFSAAGFEVDVPEGVDSLGFKVVFAGHEYSTDPSVAVHDVLVSDGIFVPVPVYPDAQVLVESHSAVLPGGESADEVVAGLRDAFVNVSAAGAEYSEVSVMDMIREALPVAYEDEDKDAVSQSEAMYVNFMAAGLRTGDDVRSCVEAAMNSVSRLLKCANDDGGFGWFEGMPSSPVVTAVVLERYAGLRDRGLLDVASRVWGEDSLDDLDAAAVEAVKYLDSSYFGDSGRPAWYGRLSLEQYLGVRTEFTGVEFDADAARKAVGRKKFRKFSKDVKAYLISADTETSGNVLSKVRKVRIIIDLIGGTSDGYRLCRGWGVFSMANVKKMVKTMDRELVSLKQYAVEHPSGGVYYPNAVLPWRGLLESEAYAHARICDLFRDVAGEYYGDDRMGELADGIRIWMMLQKETQEWSSDPGYVEALASVYDGSAAVKDTKVIILSKRYTKPFDEIKAAGNGFKLSADYYKAGSDGARVRLAEGDSLHVGDKITAVYSIWSEENRSHVRLSVPRAACFRPAEQLSGWNGGWFRPLSYGVRTVSPYSYREVKSDRTLWWIDVFPEENTSIEEELFVTQEGVFTSPVAEIESLYAHHYRANDSFNGRVETL